MWFSVVMLIVFASLHDGVKSNTLDAVQGYVNTAAFAGTQVYSQTSTRNGAPAIQGGGGGVLTYINSEPTAIRVNIAVGNEPYVEGSEINIACNVAGDPAPTILWYKDGNLIQVNDRIKLSPFALIISDAKQNDAGRYRCEASNKYSSSAATVDIRVGTPNYSIITGRQQNTATVAAGTQAQAAAVAGSFGGPNYSIVAERAWQNNQVPIVASAAAVPAVAVSSSGGSFAAAAAAASG